MNIQDIARKCIQCQDASNLSGLVHSWSVWLPLIREDSMKRGCEPNQHPINRMMADKLLQLSGGFEDRTFISCYNEVAGIAGF